MRSFLLLLQASVIQGIDMLYLTISFEQKELLKQLGAKWDLKEKGEKLFILKKALGL